MPHETGPWLPAALLVLATAMPGLPAEAATPHRATRIISTAQDAAGRGCTVYGTGLAVGEGLVLTAAHVLLAPADLVGNCGFATAAPVRVDVAFGAGSHTARILAQGRRIDAPRMHFAGAGDYAILRVAVPMHSPPLAPCAAPARARQHVRILTWRREIAAAVAAAQTVKTGDDAGYFDLDAILVNGDSGAGVLDAATGCVLGVVSHGFPEPAPTVTRITPVRMFAEAWRQARPPMPQESGAIELRPDTRDPR